MKFVNFFVFLISGTFGASITKFDQSQHGTYNVQIHLKNLELIAILDDTLFGGLENDVYDYDYTDVSGTNSPSSNISITTSPPTTTSPTSGPTSKPTVTPTKPANNRLTTIINNKLTPKPINPNSVLTTKTNVTKPSGNIKSNVTTSNIGSQGNGNTVTAKSPYSKITPEYDQLKVSTSLPTTSTTGGTTFVTSPNDVIDSTQLDMLSIPVEVQQTSSSGGSMMIKKCAPGYFRDTNGKCRRIRKPHLPFLQMVHTPGVIKSFQGVESSTKKMGMSDLTNGTIKQS